MGSRLAVQERPLEHMVGLNNILFMQNTYMYVQYIMVQDLTVSKVLICKPSPGAICKLQYA